jgi:hypothetical protein
MIELNGENYLDGQEASSLLGIKLSTLYTYVSRGIVKSYKQGIKRQRLYKQAELEALLRLRPSDTGNDVVPTGDPASGVSVAASPSQSVGATQITELPYARDWVPNV